MAQVLGAQRGHHPIRPDAAHARDLIPVSHPKPKEHSMTLTGKIAFVTGAASGIGKEIALEYVLAGAKVAIADINQAASDATAAEIGKDKAIGVAADVTDEAQVEAAVAKTIKAFGNIDILVSNAGIQIVHPV